MVVSGDSQVHDAVCAVHVEVVFNWKVFGVDQTRVANFNFDRRRCSSHWIPLIHHQDLESDIRRVGPDDIQNILCKVPLRNRRTENIYVLGVMSQIKIKNSCFVFAHFSWYVVLT